MSTSPVDKTKPKSSLEIKWQPNTKLTRKQNAFIQEYIKNPKQSATAAVKKTYNTTTDLSARQQAHDNLTNPNIQMELAKYSETAENTMLDIMNYSAEQGRTKTGAGQQGAAYATVGARVAMYIHDKVHGKAAQHITTETTAVVLNISLTDKSSP